MSPAFACGGAPAAKSYRSYESGERTQRRQASTKRKTPRVAKHEAVKTKNEHKQAKIDLPEKKQHEAKTEAPAQKPQQQQQAAVTPARDQGLRRSRRSPRSPSARSRSRRAIVSPRPRAAWPPTTALNRVRRQRPASASTPVP
ncbi:MAG: hypothetical protein WDN31_17410 [Hyphomicrobium sp.]